jgi:WhiB family transcriptional regulator, redox-sensing transcriptional regulator
MAALPMFSASMDTEWQQNALCRADDGGVFFPPAHFEHKPEREAREARARAICAGCPVRRPCLEWALGTQEPYGVWGGCSETERKQLLLGRRAAS